MALGTFSACDSSAWRNVLLTVETVSSVTILALAVVGILVSDGGVWDTVGVVSAIVVLAGINLITDFAVTVVADLALAGVVDFVSDEARSTLGVLVATTIVGLAWIVWQTFWSGVTGLAFASVTDSVLAGNASSVVVADVVA